MTDRTLVPIFIFWAFLTIITPTLVLLSENSKQDLIDLYGNSTEVVADDRRSMMGHIEYRINTTTTTTTMRPWATEELTDAPAEAPNVTGANLTAASGHNGSHGSNRSDDHAGLRRVFPRKQLKQTTLLQ